MRLDNTKIIRNIEELLFEFGVNGETYKNITFYCRDLNHFYEPNVFNGEALYNKIITRLFSLKQYSNKSLSVKTYKYLDKPSLFNKNITKKNNKITLLNSSIYAEILSEEQDPVEEFVDGLIYLANRVKSDDSEVKNFEEASSILVSEYNTIEKRLWTLMDKLKVALIDRANIILIRENFSKRDEVIKTIEESFDEIKKNLKKASEDGDTYIKKEIFKFFMSFFDITDFKKSFGLLNIVSSTPDALKTTENIFSSINKRGSYAFSSPVMSLLATKFGFILGLLNTVSFNNILVFTNDDQKSGAFIDFSGFDIAATNTKSNYDEYIGICSNFSLEGDEKSLFDAKISKYENIDKKNNISICKNDKDNTEESLLKRIEECVIANRANFVYMQYPFFNSLKFANLLRDKSLTTKDNTHNTNNSSGISKNYLVVSNAPSILNAKLNEHLLQNVLNYKIVDSLNRADDKKVTDPKQLNGTKDYSQYSIQIDAQKEEDLYLLSLSPFTRVGKDRIKKFQKDIDTFNDFMQDKQNQINTIMYFDTLSENEKQVAYRFLKANSYLGHINKYFKNAKDMEEIVKNEKDFLDASIKEFETFFSSINSSLEHSESHVVEIPSLQNLNSMMKKNDAVIKVPDIIVLSDYYYPATRVFLLVMGYYVIRQTFDNSMISQNFTVPAYESIKISDKSFMVCSEHSYYLKEDGVKVPICFFKKTKEDKIAKLKTNKEENKEIQNNIICIEEIVETIEKSHVRDIDHVLDDHSYEELKELLKNYTGLDGESVEDEKFTKNIKQLDDDEYKYTIDFAMISTLDDILYDIFPFYGFFIGKSYETILKSITKAFFSSSKDNLLKNIFIELVGELKTFSTLNELPVAKIVNKDHGKIIKEKKKKGFIEITKEKSNKILLINMERTNKTKRSLKNAKKWIDEFEVGEEIKRQIAIKAGKEFVKNSSITFVKDLVKAGFGFFVDSFFINTYEQQKRSYELILHKYFTNKFNDAYAVKNISYEPYSNETGEYTYYPIEIYSSFINIDLKRTIIGGRLSSGGLDYHNFFYYDINTTTNKLDSNLSKDISLDTMISYLCLDELRTDNKTDEEFFNNLNKRNKKLAYSPKELMLQGVKTLLTISPSNPIDIKQREGIYNMYKESVAENKSANATFDIPIDKYNEAMEILEDFKNGNLNTFGSEVDNKSRRLLKALDVIGNNNVKGMYVGCKENDSKNGKFSDRTIPPRLIGRLATTIVMEDGLYIG